MSASGNNLIFTLTGTYSLTVRGADTPFLTMDPPSFSVTVPSTTRWEDLPDVLMRGFADASVDVVRDLLSRPDKAALFLVMLFGDDAYSLALEMICHDLVDESVAAAVGAGMSALSGAGGPATAGAASVVLSAITATLAESAGDGDHGGGGEGTDTPPIPIFKSLVYSDSDRAIVATWNPVRRADGYQFELLRPDGTFLVPTRFVDYHQLTFQIVVYADGLAVGTYLGRLRSLRGSRASDSATRELVKPAAPPATLTYDGAVLTVRWTDSGADDYRIVFNEGRSVGGMTQFAETTVPGTAREVSTDLPDPQPGVYNARAQGGEEGSAPRRVDAHQRSCDHGSGGRCQGVI